MKYYVLGFITALSVILIAASGYFLGKESAESRLANSQVSPTPTFGVPSATPTPTPSFTQEEIKNAIVLAVTNQKYTDLVTYMDNDVHIRLENEDCCDPLPKNDAIAKLEVLNKATKPWDFNDNNSIASRAAQMYPEHYSRSVIGTSRNKYIAAFQLNNMLKIIKVSISPNYDQLLP